MSRGENTSNLATNPKGRPNAHLTPAGDQKAVLSLKGIRAMLAVLPTHSVQQDVQSVQAAISMSDKRRYVRGVIPTTVLLGLHSYYMIRERLQAT